MSIEISTIVWKNSQQRGTHKLFLLALADHANGDGYCYPGIERIARMCNVTDRQARRISLDLQTDGEILVNTGGGRNGTNEYIITVAMPTEDIEKCASKYFGITPKQALALVQNWQMQIKPRAVEVENPDTDVSPDISDTPTETLTPMPPPPDTRDRNPDTRDRNPDTNVSRTVINHQLTINEPSIDLAAQKTEMQNHLKTLFTIAQESDLQVMCKLFDDIPNLKLWQDTAHSVRAGQKNAVFDPIRFTRILSFQHARLQAQARRPGG